ncbi:MAG: M28 family peptidase [Bacilli bacterium]
MLKDLYVELTLFQERMHSKSKSRFRDYLQTKAQELNLNYQISPKSWLSKNVLIGNLETAEYVFTAHYDTPPRMPNFLVKNIIFYNILILLVVIGFILLSIFFSLHPLIPLILIILFMGYNFGFPAISNKYNFNDNTSGVLTVLNLMHRLQNAKTAFVFFDNEEKGLFGSIGLARYLHKKKLDFRMRKFINFDCVGRGNVFSLDHFNRPQLANQIKATFDKLQIKNYECEVRKGRALELSDHLAFSKNTHVGIFALKRVKNKLVIDNIHSHKDREIDLNNILVLTRLMETFVNQKGVIDGTTNNEKI